MQERFLKTKIKKASGFLRLLSSTPRLEILCLLSQDEMSVGQIQKKIQISQSALSQHLNKLRTSKILKTRKVRQTVYYSIQNTTALKIIDVLHKIYCK